jgi:hypothetical protein
MVHLTSSKLWGKFQQNFSKWIDDKMKLLLSLRQQPTAETLTKSSLKKLEVLEHSQMAQNSSWHIQSQCTPTYIQTMA